MQGPTTDLLIYTTDQADAVTCRVLKAFEMPAATHALMHFTAPKVAGKRIVPNFYGIHDYTSVYVHVRMVERPGLDAICAGVKRMGLGTEDDVTHDLKRLCIGDVVKKRSGEDMQVAVDAEDVEMV